MMLVPRNNSFSLFDDFFDDDIFSNSKRNSLMKTDIRETKNNYLIDIDLPGYEKQNISLSLNNGYLEIDAKIDQEENDEEDTKFVRRERYIGRCSRSFYVGDNITEEDIDAEFKNGILKISIPKKENAKTNEEIKQIEIK